MRPFILTELQAGKLPRWALWMLCALYALPGFIGRDPWRVNDAAGFGVALTMARGGLADWLMPNISGQPVYDDGPLPFWLAGGAARLLPILPEHVTVRAVAVIGLFVLFIGLWYASYSVARRPGAQPSDPFGASASRVDYGRAVADSALLVLLATLGLIARLHETTAAAAEVAWIALFLFGLAYALDYARRGGLLAGAAVAATALTRGLPYAIALLAVLLLLPALSRSYRLILRPFWLTSLPVAVLGSVLWPWLLGTSGPAGSAYLHGWWSANLALVTQPNLDTVLYWFRTAPWFFWPAWPIAVWAIVRWRSSLSEPAIVLPLLTLAALLPLAWIAPRPDEAALLPLAPAFAMLAAVGLPTLKRAVVSLVDWFSVMTFSLFGLAAWGYWIAYITGYPPKMAYRASQLAPGFKPEWIVDEIVLGGLATIAWLLLVRWRVSRQPPMIWRAVVLASGGLVLAWCLLMTLWLSVFDERNTYRELARRTAEQLPPGYDCVATRALGLTERTSLAYFGILRFGRDQRDCDWLLIEDGGPLARVLAPDEPGWVFAWQGMRRNDTDERFRLYRRRR